MRILLLIKNIEERDMKALLSKKSKRKLKKLVKKLWEKLIDVSMESPMAPVWIPRKK